jgi:hypothetical protein
MAARKKDEIFDKHCGDLIDDNINMTVPWYLMAAYAYYEEDRPILSDSYFDRLAKKMIKDWDSIDHFHKDCISKDMLEAGTFLGEYPSRVKYGLQALRGKDGR